MPNMSYCRFENTFRDLLDCYHNMDNDDLSKTEFQFRQRMVELCIKIADQYANLLDEEFEEEFEDEE